jgi:YVTN family beta-propeller protein
VLVAVALVVCAAPARAATSRTAYVATGSGSVTPIDTATNTAGAEILVGSFPRAVAITADGRTAYSTNEASNSVTPIDTATNTPGVPIPVGIQPVAIAITPDGKTAYVANNASDSVTPIDTATNNRGAAILLTTGSLPSGIAITPDGKTAYVTNNGLGSVTPINIATNTAGPAIPVGTGPQGVAITPDGKTAYVTNFNDGTVTPIVIATNTAGPAIPVGTGPQGVAITPDGKTAYVTNVGSNTVTPINIATNTAGPAIPVGGGALGVAITPDGKTAYVTNPGSDSVTPIDTATNTTGTAIPVVNSPVGIAVTPDQGPVAGFSATAAPVGQASSFDGSASSDSDGTVASYHWDFGDGSSQTTASATTTHTYAVRGTYTVTLTVTDDAGCSTTQTFTGQTVSCNGSSAAQLSKQVTVTAATPGIGTQQQPASATVGSSIADRAIVSGGDSPAGTVTFRLFNNPNGTGTPLFTDTEPLSGATATSKGYTATATGDDYWVATYNGDSNNNPVSSGTAGEPVTVSAATPTISTHQQPTSATVGNSIADKATVSGGSNPAGTVTFRLFNNPHSTGTPLFTDTEPLSGATAISKGYTATATGTDYWVATYNGNSNNHPVSSGTGGEPVTISPAAPTIGTHEQPASTTVGGSIADEAIVSGGHSPAGTVTFRLFNNPHGTGTPLFSNTEPLHDRSATSKRYTPTASGTYYWVATYNGDSNNHPVSSGHADEPVRISPAALTISTHQQPASALVGGSIADEATVSGGHNPAGTVSFRLFNNPHGTGTPLFTNTEPLHDRTATSKRYTPTATGTYYWVATYNGDSNNHPVSSGHADEPVSIDAVMSVARVRIASVRPAPLTPGCVVETGLDEHEITALTAANACRQLRLSVSGTIQTNGRLATTATGTIHLTYKVRLPRGPAAGGAHAPVNHGHWRISLLLPGVNLDPIPPLYLITIHYSGDHTHTHATATHRIRLESERAGL